MPMTAAGYDDDDEDDELIDCPECGAEVYAIADSCPKCGYWFVDDERETIKGKRQTAGERRFVKIGAIVLLAAFALSAAATLLLAFSRGG